MAYERETIVKITEELKRLVSEYRGQIEMRSQKIKINRSMRINQQMVYFGKVVA